MIMAPSSPTRQTQPMKLFLPSVSSVNLLMQHSAIKKHCVISVTSCLLHYFEHSHHWILFDFLIRWKSPSMTWTSSSS